MGLQRVGHNWATELNWYYIVQSFQKDSQYVNYSDYGLKAFEYLCHPKKMIDIIQVDTLYILDAVG